MQRPTPDAVRRPLPIVGPLIAGLALPLLWCLTVSALTGLRWQFQAIDGLLFLLAGASAALCLYLGLAAGSAAQWLRRQPGWVAIPLAYGVFLLICVSSIVPHLARTTKGSSVFLPIFLSVSPIAAWLPVLVHAALHPAWWRELLLRPLDLRSPRFLLLPLFSTAAFHSLTAPFVAHFFTPGAFLVSVPALELALEALLSYALFFCARRVALFLLAQQLLLGICYAGNALTIAFLATPVSVPDLREFPTLVLTFPPPLLAAALAPIIVCLLAFALNFRWRFRLLLLSAAVAFAAVSLFDRAPAAIANALNARYIYIWGHPEGTYRQRGPLLYLINDLAMSRAYAPAAPTAEEIKKVLAEMRVARDADAGAAAPADRRNVYLLILESFSDVNELTSAHFERNVFDEGFQTLWRDCGTSHTLSPMFGGGTANVEFEALFGMPLLLNGNVFRYGIVNQAPSLVGALKRQGYRTFAFDTLRGGVFNKRHVFQMLGLDRTYWRSDFVADDLNGDFLADESYYRQIVRKIDWDDPTPRFVYVLTGSGHYDYTLNPAKRPPVVEGAGASAIVRKDASMAYYTSRELMAFVAQLRNRDPRALIVAFGDHRPKLDMDDSTYIRSGVFAAAGAEETARTVRNRQATPLAVIDGEAGPVAWGDVPTYRVPALMLAQLGLPAGDYWNCFRPRVPDGCGVRFLKGQNLLTCRDGALTLCGDGAADGLCGEIAAWKRGMSILENDILRGKQHAVMSGDCGL
jgi:phosphoglycerol transferase MdoB-like AlkP superfamily enzyme